MKRSRNYEAEFKNAQYPYFRLLHILYDHCLPSYLPIFWSYQVFSPFSNRSNALLTPPLLTTDPQPYGQLSTQTNQISMIALTLLLTNFFKYFIDFYWVENSLWSNKSKISFKIDDLVSGQSIRLLFSWWYSVWVLNMIFRH